jgi:hypothetical protein
MAIPVPLALALVPLAVAATVGLCAAMLVGVPLNLVWCVVRARVNKLRRSASPVSQLTLKLAAAPTRRPTLAADERAVAIAAAA